MEKKSFENFEKHFVKALFVSRVRFFGESSFFTERDLRQECYLTYHRAKEDNGDRSYDSYINTRLIGAIWDYRRKILKLRRRPGCPTNMDNISLATPVRNYGRNNYEIVTLEDTLKSEQTINFDLEIMTEEILSNGLLTGIEKKFFTYYLIDDLKLKEVATIFGYSPTLMSIWKKEILIKLKERYEFEN